ncbi:MAG: polymer-forming cytoskeletal protein [Parcubacteria group bacterium]
MFKNNEGEIQSPETKENVETIVGASVKVEGDLIGQNNMKIYGQVAGKVVTKGDIFIEESANIEADVEANNVTISGTVQGSVKAIERLEVQKSGKISGDIAAKILSIATGANFSGQCNMSDNNSQDTSPLEKLKEKTPLPKVDVREQ